MNTALRHFIVAASIALGASFAAGNARADVPPPDACNSPDVGKACSNAGPQGSGPGVCTKTTCTKQLGPEGGPYTYDCTLCLPADAGGTGGAGGSTGAGGGAGAGTKKGGFSDSGGCALAGAPRGGALLGVMLALGLGSLLARRCR